MARRSTKALHAGRYNPKAATAARFRKTVAGPRQAARLARKAATAEKRRSGVLASPRGKRLSLAAKERALGPQSSWPEEWRYLRRQSLADALGRPEAAGFAELWRELVDEEYRKRYNAQQRQHRAAKPKAAGAWVRVRSYRRRRPGR